jgi:hypothetical protein
MKLVSIVTVGLLLSHVALAEIPIRSSRSAREQFDSYVELLRKDVAMSKDKKQKYQVLNLTLNQLKSLRAEVAEGEDADTTHMDLMITSLEAIPSSKQFKKKNCEEYKAGLPAETGENASLASDFISSLCI